MAGLFPSGGRFDLDERQDVHRRLTHRLMSSPGPRGATRAAGALLLLAWLLAQPVAAASTLSVPSVSPEVPATTTDLALSTADNSPMLLADPTEPRFVVLAHRTDAPTFGCGLQVSGDG